MAGNFDGIKTRRFGVEIEMTGITRCAAAKAIQKLLGGSIDHEGGTCHICAVLYSTWRVQVCGIRKYSKMFQKSLDILSFLGYNKA